MTITVSTGNLPFPAPTLFRNDFNYLHLIVQLIDKLIK